MSNSVDDDEVFKSSTIKQGTRICALSLSLSLTLSLSLIVIAITNFP